MSVYRGHVYTVPEMIRDVLTAAPPDWRALRGDRWLWRDAADTARYCRQLLDDGESLSECWRFGILQTIDDYNLEYACGQAEWGQKVFIREPTPTRSVQIDAAYAALAEHLADRDGWQAPAWTTGPSRYSLIGWYVAPYPRFHLEADSETPLAFARHGIHVSWRDLVRV